MFDPITTCADPSLVDTTGRRDVTINVMQANMVVNITRAGIQMDFWNDDSDGEPHDSITLTFAEWQAIAKTHPLRNERA